MPDSETADAVVIGTGPNGLVAANVLLSRDLDRTAASLATFAPADAWRAEFTRWQRIRDPPLPTGPCRHRGWSG